MEGPSPAGTIPHVFPLRADMTYTECPLIANLGQTNLVQNKQIVERWFLDNDTTPFILAGS